MNVIIHDNRFKIIHKAAMSLTDTGICDTGERLGPFTYYVITHGGGGGSKVLISDCEGGGVDRRTV